MRIFLRTSRQRGRILRLLLLPLPWGGLLAPNDPLHVQIELHLLSGDDSRGDGVDTRFAARVTPANYGVRDHLTPEETDAVDKHLSAFPMPLGFPRLTPLRNQFIRMLPFPGSQRLKGEIGVLHITCNKRHREGEQTQANKGSHWFPPFFCPLYTPIAA